MQVIRRFNDQGISLEELMKKLTQELIKKEISEIVKEPKMNKKTKE